MTPNYLVLKGYNFSDSYAMSVAHMADRLKGSGGFVDDWPRGAALPNREQRTGIQEMLIRLRLLDGVADGRIGPKTQEAYAKFQASRGEVADGFVTAASYDALKAAM
jgi:membrane-bound lytic murein transglycosylase B